MNKTPNGGVAAGAAAEQKLEEQAAPLPVNVPPKRQYKPKVQRESVTLDNPAEAEVLRAGLAGFEFDMVVREGDKWIYVRQRAFAEEETGDVASEGSSAGGTKGEGAAQSDAGGSASSGAESGGEDAGRAAGSRASGRRGKRGRSKA